MHWAALHKPNPEIIRILLSRGAGAAAKDYYGISVLSYALTYGNSSQVIGLLLEHGADANARGGYDRPPLHEAVALAAYASDPEAASSFPEDGADVAAYALEIIQLLLEYGADAWVRDDPGQSAMFTYLGILIEMESYNADPEVVRLLLDHGGAVAMENDGGELLMTYAMWAGANPEVIRLLLEHGADATGIGDEGDTRLRCSAQALKCSSCCWRTGRTGRPGAHSDGRPCI